MEGSAETHEERCARELKEQGVLHKQFVEDSKRHDDAVKPSATAVLNPPKGGAVKADTKADNKE